MDVASGSSNKLKNSFFSLKQLTAKAVELEKGGKPQTALSLYLQLIRSNLRQPDWVYCHAIGLIIELEHFATGSIVSESALIAHPQSERVYRVITKLYKQEIDLSNSINHYQQLLTFEPQQPNWLYYNLAQQLLHRERTIEAVEVAGRGINLHGNFYPLHYLTGNIFSELKQWDKAIAFYQRVKQANPNWLDVEQELNRALYNRDRQNELIQPPAKDRQNSQSDKVEGLDSDRIFNRLEAKQLSIAECHGIIADAARKLELDYGCWLTPTILYLEAQITNLPAKTEILICSERQYAIAKANIIQISPQQSIVIACFANNLYLAENNYRLCINNNNVPIFVAREVTQQGYGLEFVNYLKTKSDRQKHSIREFACSSIIELIPEVSKPEAKDLLQKLQYFLDIPPRNYIEPNLPFKIFIDYIIPLQSDGLFISGWLQDAYEMLEEITIVSALGFSLKLSKAEIFLLERNDVEQFLQNTRYSDFEADLGFCAYAPVPKQIRDTIEGLAELHSFRFIVKLQGNIDIEIIPDAKYSDCYNARQKVLQIASPDKISADLLTNCIAPVGLKLQQICIDRVKIKDIVNFGQIPVAPLISIIIPLYRRLDFLKVQLATMANDPAIAKSEIIYVLDSPEQEEELKTFLASHCTLYQLPVKLVVMERNSGYAAANNAGASQATGKYLILLNSDVFAEQKGWMLKLVDFYASSPKIGVLGAKLLYEDGSLQHAGMFFSQTTYPFWLTLHYYKGLPGNYPPAQKTRAVPAITGACLMVTKELYDRVGGMTTDYIIGDFEDSDLCFKCRQLGYESWYYADVSLYHLERQSVPFNGSYNDSLAWLLNGRIHQQRWGNEIKQVMADMKQQY